MNISTSVQTNQISEHKIVNIFLSISILPFVLIAQKNCFIETVLLSTHNALFGSSLVTQD